MFNQEFDNFDSIFYHYIGKLLNNCDYECKPRGMKIKELVANKIILSNPRNRTLQFNNRNMSMPYAIGEFCFYMRGENKLNTMQYYSKAMKRFSDDGETLNSAYGYRIFGNHKIINHNQWERVKKQIKNDRDTRQAIIHIQTPDELTRKTNDLTCTIYLNFLVRNNKLHLITHMRSNDIWWGLTYDLFSFTMMQELMSVELDIELGKYIHITDSLHLYEKNFISAKNLLSEKCKFIPGKKMNEVEIDELYLLLENEESIRNNGEQKYIHKSEIYNNFIEILKKYREQKNDNNY